MNADERKWHPDQPRFLSTNTPCAVKIPPASASRRTEREGFTTEPQRHGGRGPPAPFAFIRVHPRFQMGPPPLRSEAPVSRARQENRK